MKVEPKGKFFSFNIFNLSNPSDSDQWRDSIRFNVLADGISLIPVAGFNLTLRRE